MYNFSNDENVTKLDRTTIADGDNLNAINVLPLSSRDSTLLNDLNETYDVVDDVTTTVSTYSGSWQNSAISGFSAIQVSSLNDHSVKKFVGGAAFTDRFTIVTYPIDLFRIGLDSNGYFRFSAADMLNSPAYSSYYKLYKTLNGTSNVDLPGSVALRWSNCKCTDYSFTDSMATPDDNVSHSSVYIPFVKDENGNDTTNHSISFSEGDTTNKSLNLSYNTKAITIRNDYFGNTDIINDLIANKPGKALNDAIPYYNKGSELMGIFKATNCAAFNDEESHIVTGSNNTALGKSQEIYTGNNNTVCGDGNKLQLIQPSSEIPENNVINGYQNTINANVIKDNIINGSSNTINFANGYNNDAPVRTNGTVQNNIISGNTNALYTELTNSVVSGWNNIIFNDSTTSTVYPTARCMVCGESNKITKANNSIISGYNNTVKNPRNSIISGRDSNIGNSTDNVDSSIVVTDNSDLSNTSINGSLIVGTGLTTNTLETGATVLGKFNTDATDKIFVIGNGSSSSNRKNAVEVDKNNNLTVAGTINITDNSVNPAVVIDLLAKIKELENNFPLL